MTGLEFTMQLAIASFAIAVISLFVSIASFILGKNEDNKIVRYGFGSLFLVATMIFVFLGVSGFVDSKPPTSSCQAITGKLPNSPQGVREEYGIPADKGIRLFYEICPDAPNGFVVEESSSLFTMQVPQGGCIDSYSGAEFSDATVPEEIGGGRRAYSGYVTATSLTYRIAGCESKP